MVIYNSNQVKRLAVLPNFGLNAALGVVCFIVRNGKFTKWNAGKKYWSIQRTIIISFKTKEI